MSTDLCQTRKVKSWVVNTEFHIHNKVPKSPCHNTLCDLRNVFMYTKKIYTS